MSSSRLPGKVTRTVVGQPMLSLQLERLKRTKMIDRLVVATSTGSDDDEIEKLCTECDVACFRGELNDVLDRYYQAAREYGADTIMRLTADCPLTDPEVIDRLIEFFEGGNFDYASNVIERTWPRGLDAEIMSFETLERVWHEAKTKPEREHVTLHIYTHPQRFRLGSLTNDIDLSHLRWTVDEAADMEMVSCVYEALYREDPTFTTADVVAYLDRNPQVAAINASVQQMPVPQT